MPGDFRKYGVEAFRQMDEGAVHLTMEEIEARVQGRLSGPRRTAAEAHLAHCAGCRQRVSEFEAFLKDCEGPVAIPRRTIEEEYSELTRRLPRANVVRMPRRWVAIAAAVILTLGLAGGAWWLTPSTPRLLAQAYRERRTSEFRIAGAGYAELRQERAGGSAFSMPGSLLKAQARIQDDLKSHDNDADLLRLEGEAQIIGGDAAGAMKTLSRARDLRPGDAQILADLGSAYSILGDVEHEFDDYKQGLDLLDQSLRLRSGNAETLFNRAVVLEKLMILDQAEIAWNEYLKSDPDGDWAREARQRLAAIQQKMQQREKKLGEVRDDPGYFLALADGDGVDAEAWLISRISTAWLVRSAADVQARQAVLKLADILARKHGDTWLRDMTAESCTSAAALAKLPAADDRAPESDAALTAAEEASFEFQRAGCSAGAMRARLSLIMAKKVSARTVECSSDADQLNRELETRSYVRLRARAARESAVCAMRLGRLDEADTKERQALQMSRAVGYGATSLELLNSLFARTSAPGLPTQTIASAGEALHFFWSGAYPRDLMYSAAYELRLFAERSEQKGAALYFARSAVWATHDSPAASRVQTYAALGVAESQLGMMREAQADLETSNRIATGALSVYRVPPAVALARFNLDQGNASLALERLLPVAEIVPRMPVVDRALYYTVLGESLARKGSLGEAATAFRKITDSSVEYVASVKSDSERDGVLKGIEGAYRGLVATQLAAAGNDGIALATWQMYRALEAPPGSAVRAPGDVPVLWFLELRDGFAAWCKHDGQTVFHRMDAPKATVITVAQRFLKESSDPRSSGGDIREDARTLYRWIVAPFRSAIGADGQNLILEPDGVLGALPLESLIDEDGRYLGDRYAVLISAGRARRKQTSIPGDAQVLVVANPLIAGVSAARFPPLPDAQREAQAIRATFGRSVLLEGRDASMEALTRELPLADILHFAGHGYSGSGNGGLLLAPADPAVGDYRLMGASDMRSMDWSRCGLAVLSACAAAEGEARGAHNPESLIRALAKAGVPRVAASLWNADSAAAAELMSQFYVALKDGRQPAEALRMAQQSLRRNSRWQHPYYWAGFQLYGTT